MITADSIASAIICAIIIAITIFAAIAIEKHFDKVMHSNRLVIAMIIIAVLVIFSPTIIDQITIKLGIIIG